MISDEAVEAADLYAPPTICLDCGGSGDAWDNSKDDWTIPRENCQACSGGGETPNPYRSQA